MLTRIVNKFDQINTPTEFINAVIENIKAPELFEEQIMKIKCYEDLLTFMENINGFEKSIQLSSFRKNTQKIFDDEISNLTTLISVKILKAKLKQSSEEKEQIKERMEALSLSVEEKEQEKQRLIKEIEDLAEQAAKSDRKNEEEREKLKSSFDLKLYEYQCLLDEAESEEELNSIASKFGPFSFLFNIGRKIAQLFH